MFPKQFEALQVMSHAVVGFPNLDENEKDSDAQERQAPISQDHDLHDE